MTTLPACPFPNVYWFANAMASQTVVDVYENYIKQSWRNRYRILGVHGAIDLTIPVVGQDGVKTPVKDIRIAPDPWQRVHWHTIKSAYGKSPFFLHFEADLANLFSSKFDFLVDFDRASTDLIIEAIGLDLQVVTSSEYIQETTLDLRPRFKGSLKGIEFPEYVQTFADRLPFLENASLLDLIMNVGPEAQGYLEKIKLTS